MSDLGDTRLTILVGACNEVLLLAHPDLFNEVNTVLELAAHIRNFRGGKTNSADKLLQVAIGDIEQLLIKADDRDYSKVEILFEAKGLLDDIKRRAEALHG